MFSSHKIVVFDLDETLGYFTQLGIFYDCLNNYLNDELSLSENENFNAVMDLYPEVIRPKMESILQYLKMKKKNHQCSKIMIYTNNQGPKSWALNIIQYFENKLNEKIFDQIICAFKVRGQRVELNRTSNSKSHDDLIKCTKLPIDTEICFIDDIYHKGMEHDKVYYINVKPYVHSIEYTDMIKRYLSSKLGNKIKNKTLFMKKMTDKINKYNYHPPVKSQDELAIDNIIGKKILQHLKQFFFEHNNKTIRRKSKKQHGTLKKKNR